jgi:hypothetical protein
VPQKEAEAAASARDKATPAALHTLRRAGKDLWGTLAPGVALEASQQLLDTLAGQLVGDVLKKQVSAARSGRQGQAEAGALCQQMAVVAAGALTTADWTFILEVGRCFASRMVCMQSVHVGMLEPEPVFLPVGVLFAGHW